MKVSELIAELSKWAPDTEVILQKDSEGNGYSPLYCVDGNAVYVAESTWGGQVYSTDNDAEDNCMDEADAHVRELHSHVNYCREWHTADVEQQKLLRATFDTDCVDSTKEKGR